MTKKDHDDAYFIDTKTVSKQRGRPKKVVTEKLLEKVAPNVQKKAGPGQPKKVITKPIGPQKPKTIKKFIEEAEEAAELSSNLPKIARRGRVSVPEDDFVLSFTEDDYVLDGDADESSERTLVDVLRSLESDVKAHELLIGVLTRKIKKDHRLMDFSDVKDISRQLTELTRHKSLLTKELLSLKGIRRKEFKQEANKGGADISAVSSSQLIAQIVNMVK